MGCEGQCAQHMVHPEEALLTDIEQSLDIFSSKFVNYVLEKHWDGTIASISKRETFRILGCLFSLSKAQSRFFLSTLSRRLSFVRFSNQGVEVRVQQI